ncbi:hypothetical protein OCO53_25335 [Peribacillus frigoritolerans]|uniref:hypothetical protein n=1 Tax=Peribacillus frigoritolerans TaxID=450367 RepID=UPI0021D0A433|nr:hypothetical protein [Peribacillus frigoritolerans]MCU6603767.1 hypothetical protein [Peribacillus frigoritolerans]
MARKGKQGIWTDIEMDGKLVDFFENEAPAQLRQARKNAVKAMGMVWADESKEVTMRGNHIDTGLYINSIGYATNKGEESHPINELSESKYKTELTIGADVSYASHLEKRYNIFARGLDMGERRMQQQAEYQVKKAFGMDMSDFVFDGMETTEE